jgi:hypothetical protein
MPHQPAEARRHHFTEGAFGIDLEGALEKLEQS